MLLYHDEGLLGRGSMILVSHESCGMRAYQVMFTSIAKDFFSLSIH
jgi:hypothetical protein